MFKKQQQIKNPVMVSMQDLMDLQTVINWYVTFIYEKGLIQEYESWCIDKQGMPKDKIN